ncbi:MAG: membrane protein insertase YidC [Gemmatimonadetes bacterium]|nr:membrane protein insertase YidC [Gemmatimonadota bacterium]
MGALWSSFVELLQIGIFTLTQFYGGHLGPAIVTFALLARLALLPLTTRIALRSRAHARRMKRIQPALQRVREQWKGDPSRTVQETMALYEREGVRPMDPALLKGTLIQTPLFLGLFQSIRSVVATGAARQPFLWIGSLAKPDLLLALLVSGLVGVGVITNASGPPATLRFLLLVSCLGTFLMLLRFSAGFGLYLGANAAVSTLQGLIVRRRERIAQAGTAP